MRCSGALVLVVAYTIQFGEDRRSTRLAGVNDVVGVGVDGVAAGTGASALAAFTIACPRRRSHQTPVT